MMVVTKLVKLARCAGWDRRYWGPAPSSPSKSAWLQHKSRAHQFEDAEAARVAERLNAQAIEA